MVWLLNKGITSCRGGLQQQYLVKVHTANIYLIRIDFTNLSLILRLEYVYTYLCSIQTPGQVGQVSQVGPWNLGSVHLHVPHSHDPRPLQICLLLAIHVLLSREQSQALPVHMGSQTHTLHSQRPCPKERKCIGGG